MNDSGQDDTLPPPGFRPRRVRRFFEWFRVQAIPRSTSLIHDRPVAHQADRMTESEATTATDGERNHPRSESSPAEAPRPRSDEPVRGSEIEATRSLLGEGASPSGSIESTLTAEPDAGEGTTLDWRRLTCPQCRTPLASVADATGNVVCRECGSSFRLEDPGAAIAADSPRTLGRFRLLERVGQGTFGVVWRAFDTKLKRTVALKIPHPSILESADFRSRFWREAQAAAALGTKASCRCMRPSQTAT